MNQKRIQITSSDMHNLRSMVQENIRLGKTTPGEAAKLVSELDRAETLDPGTNTDSVVTMGASMDLLDLNTGEVETYTLAYPEEAEPAEGRISVLAPIGTAVLGYRIGDEFRWEVPAGTRHLRIERVNPHLPPSV